MDIQMDTEQRNVKEMINKKIDDLIDSYINWDTLAIESNSNELSMIIKTYNQSYIKK